MQALAIRPAWTPLTVVLTILGFIAFWPLGVAMSVYVIWGDRIMEELRNLKFRAPAAAGFRHTGNSAFDEYRAATLRRLDEERRRLDDEQREFHEFLANLRRARDQEEFDRFMAERRSRRPDVEA